MTTPTLEIAYHDLTTELKTILAPESNYEFSKRKSHQTDIGVFQESSIAVGAVRVHEIKTNFKRDCKISVTDEGLSQAIHLCLPIEGSVGATFDDAQISAVLKPRNHHYMFVQGDEYELEFEKDVRLAHVEIGLEYFNSLLCPSERWSAELQEKIFKQEVVYSGGMTCRTTNDIVDSILNCPLSGKLRKLFLDAKVSELVALQLIHYSGLADDQPTPALKKSEVQLMEDVKSFLSENFNDDHSLQSIASHFAINEFKLKKNFKLRFGQTIFDFLFDRKMDHAYYLLRDGGKFVNEVSREVGYKNPNHFTTAFTKKFGVKPSSVKK
jgi:AraC family transcriptional regulator, transcriptional activator of the genes for pyochelin and ferripyochelin receptors